MSVLVYLEHVDGTVDEQSLQAATVASSLTGGDEDVHAVMASDTVSLALEGALPVEVVHVAVHDAFGSYAPLAIAEAIVVLVGRLGAAAVVGPGTERGNEVLAHVAARLGLPMSAHTLEVTPGASWLVTRERWGGSLLEDATLDAPVRVLTVAARDVEVEPPGPPRAVPTITRFAPELQPADLVARVVSREPKPSTPPG